MRPEQNGWHFTDNFSKRIFLKENILIQVKVSLKFVPMGPTENMTMLVWLMDWHRTGVKPLPEPMMTLMTDTYIRHPASMSLCDSHNMLCTNHMSNIAIIIHQVYNKILKKYLCICQFSCSNFQEHVVNRPATRHIFYSGNYSWNDISWV